MVEFYWISFFSASPNRSLVALTKMSNLLILLSFWLAAHQVHWTVEALRLENLCDIFHYDGLFVNAVHRFGQVVYLPEISYFLVPEADDFTFVRNLRNEILQIKSDYNSRLRQIYSEAYVNGPNFETAIRQETTFFDKVLERLQQVRERVDQQLLDWFDKQTRTFHTGQQLVDFLLPFLDNRLQPARPSGYAGLQPNKEKQYAALESYLLKRLDPDANQTFALHDHFMSDIYELPIVSRPRLEFSRLSSTFFDPKSYGRLRFEIVLPFYSRAYERSPCVEAAKLPKFFAKR